MPKPTAAAPVHDHKADGKPGSAPENMEKQGFVRPTIYARAHCRDKKMLDDTLVRRLNVGPKPQEEAEAACQAIGTRLCTKDEAFDHCIGRGTGYGFDTEFVATSTKCSDENYWATKGAGNMDYLQRDDTLKCMAPEQKRMVQCCHTDKK